MKKFCIKLIEKAEYTKSFEVQVPDTWTTEATVRDQLNPTNLDMYQEQLPDEVTILYEGDEWDSDWDIMGRGHLVLGEIKES